ncbi:hypothetical protein H8356DRAFT_1429462 [Neocallimastix lanati (nom. inval.)]|nr:hypothetical protein H8356DRAFT_1429462 [Neocallimastix sp. JGI-2020a]
MKYKQLKNEVKTEKIIKMMENCTGYLHFSGRLKNDDNIEKDIVFNMFNMYFLTPPRLGLETPLYFAYGSGNENSIKYSVEHEAKLETKNLMKCSMEHEHRADINKEAKYVKYLDELEAYRSGNENFHISMNKINIEIPLFEACSKRHENIVKYLAYFREDESIIKLLVELLTNIKKKDNKSNKTPTTLSDINIRKISMEKFRDVNKEDESAKTLLFYSCERGVKHFIKYLVEHREGDINKENIRMGKHHYFGHVKVGKKIQTYQLLWGWGSVREEHFNSYELLEPELFLILEIKKNVVVYLSPFMNFSNIGIRAGINFNDKLLKEFPIRCGVPQRVSPILNIKDCPTYCSCCGVYYSISNLTVVKSVDEEITDSDSNDNFNLNISNSIISNVSNSIENNVYVDSSVCEKVFNFLLGGRSINNSTREWKDLFKCQMKSGAYSNTPFLVVTAALLQSIIPIAIGQQWSLFNRFKSNHTTTTKSVNAEETVRQASRTSATNEDHNFMTGTTETALNRMEYELQGAGLSEYLEKNIDDIIKEVKEKYTTKNKNGKDILSEEGFELFKKIAYLTLEVLKNKYHKEEFNDKILENMRAESDKETLEYIEEFLDVIQKGYQKNDFTTAPFNPKNPHNYIKHNSLTIQKIKIKIFQNKFSPENKIKEINLSEIKEINLVDPENKIKEKNLKFETYDTNYCDNRSENNKFKSNNSSNKTENTNIFSKKKKNKINYDLNNYFINSIYVSNKYNNSILNVEYESPGKIKIDKNVSKNNLGENTRENYKNMMKKKLFQKKRILSTIKIHQKLKN